MADAATATTADTKTTTTGAAAATGAAAQTVQTGQDGAAQTGAAATTGDTKTTATTGKSILEGGVKEEARAGEDGKDAAARAAAGVTWPDDWRTQMAGGNAEVEALLKRYASPGSVATALKSLRTRLDSGEFKKPLPADATDDEKAAWRKDNGIPDKPEGYEMPKGLEIAPIDKPIVDTMLKLFHENGETPAKVQQYVDQFFKAREAENQQMYDNDQAYRAEQEDVLRAEYGQDFRGNINGLRSFVTTTWGKEMADAIMGARLADGTLAGNNPGFLKPLIQIMRDVDPAATVTSAAGDRGGKGVESRLAELNAMMAKDINAWQAESNKPLQDEYMELIRAKEKIDARAKAA